MPCACTDSDPDTLQMSECQSVPNAHGEGYESTINLLSSLSDSLNSHHGVSEADRSDRIELSSESSADCDESDKYREVEADLSKSSLLQPTASNEVSTAASLHCSTGPTELPSTIPFRISEHSEPCIDIGNLQNPLMKYAKQLTRCQMLKSIPIFMHMYHHQRYFLLPSHMGVTVNLRVLGSKSTHGYYIAQI